MDHTASAKELTTPLLLRVAMVLGASFGTIGTATGVVLLTVAALAEEPIGADLPSGSSALVVLFLILFLVACVTAGSASWALWKRRAQARPLLTLLLVEFVIGDTAMLAFARQSSSASDFELLFSASIFIVLVALALWYLFGKRSVVTYFDSLG